MLINLSNHPSSDWDKKQIDVANKMYGKITDMEFPTIDSRRSIEEIKQLAEIYSKRCMALLSTNDNRNAVHIMGEHTFTFSFVSKLLVKGYICVASTTKRISRVEDSKKISQFKFVKFREYSL